MGSDQGMRYGEDPMHTVTLHGFWMDTTEVTNAMFKKCADTYKCSPPITYASSTHPSYFENSQFDDYPVIYIRWEQAVSYCQWAGRRLPTEAEWEYAARGGLAEMEYPWGNEVDGSKANFCDLNCREDVSDKSMGDGFTEIAPVYSFPPNNYGLYEMAGNVAEYVSDWFGEYFAGSVIDPSGPASGEYKVVRGGSWSNQFIFLNVASRSSISPDSHGNWIGFRCASDAP